jgi:4-amino-4-deoxy-L-arabinose transferase-like glycosyltransferase
MSAARATRATVAGVLAAVALGALLRAAWLTADPPTHATLGIVWHDEGPWVHNARNRALWGAWRTDAWNPVFIAPVFTGLEYGAFRAFGVGTWQARTVPVASGLLAIAALAAGLFALAGRRAALIGASLLATNYVFVMWNRVALMESTMTAFIVVGWAAYAQAERRPLWGVVAGFAATLAFFSKAAAAFFIAAIALDAGITLLTAWSASLRARLALPEPSPSAVRGAIATFAGLAISAAVVGALFVWPYWSEYQFYNWQVSVNRKPSYALRAMIDRVTWLPVVHDYFSRMWLVVFAAAVAVVGVVARWRRVRPGERLLVLWVLVGLVELVVHDAGNERRYVMFVPALVALASLTLDGSIFRGPEVTRRPWAAVPLFALLAYIVAASLVRLAFLSDVRDNEFSMTVRLSAAIGVIAAVAIAVKWQAVTAWLVRGAFTARAALLLATLVVASDLVQYAQWALRRTYANYEASIAVGRLLPAGTLVQGKLANGLALENRIRPVFIGRGFGNYDDRTRRADIRYVLTYVKPSLGYESQARNPVIKDVLDASRGWRVVATFPVRETEGSPNEAALIAK